MKIKRFFAKDMKTALAQVKDTLGADAVIMSNKKVTGGIEIVAAIDNEPPQPETRRNELKEKLADELRQVKRKLADDKVQIGRPAPAQQAHPEKRERGTFSNLLKRYVNQDGSLDEAETEADSLSALLQRQANRGNGGGHRQESRDNGYGMPRNRYMEEQPARNRRRDDDDPNPFNRLSQKTAQPMETGPWGRVQNVRKNTPFFLAMVRTATTASPLVWIPLATIKTAINRALLKSMRCVVRWRQFAVCWNTSFPA